MNRYAHCLSHSCAFCSWTQKTSIDLRSWTRVGLANPAVDRNLQSFKSWNNFPYWQGQLEASKNIKSLRLLSQAKYQGTRVYSCNMAADTNLSLVHTYCWRCLAMSKLVRRIFPVDLAQFEGAGVLETGLQSLEHWPGLRPSLEDSFILPTAVSYRLTQWQCGLWCLLYLQSPI